MRLILQNGSGGDYALSVLLTWVVLIGAGYGFVRLLADLPKLFRGMRFERGLSDEDVERVAKASAELLRQDEPSG